MNLDKAVLTIDQNSHRDRMWVWFTPVYIKLTFDSWNCELSLHTFESNCFSLEGHDFVMIHIEETLGINDPRITYPLYLNPELRDVIEKTLKMKDL